MIIFSRPILITVFVVELERESWSVAFQLFLNPSMFRSTVSLPEKLLVHARIKANILFVGLGETFQIWEPRLFDKFKIVARKKSYQNRSNFKWENKNKGEEI